MYFRCVLTQDCVDGMNLSDVTMVLDRKISSQAFQRIMSYFAEIKLNLDI